MTFTLEPIPFFESGLGYFLSKEAINVHVTKHHQSYIDMANKLGIHGILCQDFAKVKEEISNLTGLKLK